MSMVLGKFSSQVEDYVCWRVSFATTSWKIERTRSCCFETYEIRRWFGKGVCFRSKRGGYSWLPGDSKWLFYPLFGGHLAFEKVTYTPGNVTFQERIDSAKFQFLCSWFMSWHFSLLETASSLSKAWCNWGMLWVMETLRQRNGMNLQIWNVRTPPDKKKQKVSLCGLHASSLQKGWQFTPQGSNHLLRMVMEPKNRAEDVIVHPQSSSDKVIGSLGTCQRDRNQRFSEALFHRTENDPGFLHGRGWSQGLHVSHQALSWFVASAFWKKVFECFSSAVSVGTPKNCSQKMFKLRVRAVRGHLRSLVIKRS